MVGKVIGNTVYVTVEAIEELPTDQQRDSLEAIAVAGKRKEGQVVIKLLERRQDGRRRVSVLLYEDFDRHAFPALIESKTIDLSTGAVKTRDYRGSKNPPILHRKELLLSCADPRKTVFERLTRELNARGLFQAGKAIGFRKQWERCLERAGVDVYNHHVIAKAKKREEETGDCRATGIARYRTAIARQRLSAPMQALARHGVLTEERSVFDYGCGRGDDLAVMVAAGITATGWDPHYAPGAELKAAEIVNLGYVLNVIEEPAEREETAVRAFALARQCLCVGVMIAGRGDTGGLKPYRDGYLSKRGTFQKYFAQDEIRGLLERATAQEAIAVAPGIFFVFRDKLEEQRFLANRHRRIQDISHLLAIAPPSAAEPVPVDEALLEENRELVDALWKRALTLGRLPYVDELDAEVQRAIEENIGSIGKAARLAQQVYSAGALNEARSVRVDDLRVYFALNLFNRRKRYADFPQELQRDVKAFFGSQKNAEAAGQKLLFSLGNPELIDEACRRAAERGLGYLNEGHSLQLHIGLLERLPAALRAYVGCAEKLYGDVTDADLMKIHTRSGKVTLLKYEGFKTEALPRLRERIKIKLRQQDIDFFEYGDEYPVQFLYLKSRYMAPDQPGYERQKVFDDALTGLGLFDFSDLGPSKDDFVRGLAEAGVRIRGFDVVRARRTKDVATSRRRKAS